MMTDNRPDLTRRTEHEIAAMISDALESVNEFYDNEIDSVSRQVVDSPIGAEYLTLRLVDGSEFQIAITRSKMPTSTRS